MYEKKQFEVLRSKDEKIIELNQLQIATKKDLQNWLGKITE